MMGTNNRRWSPDTNSTIFVVYFAFPDATLEDQSDVTVTAGGATYRASADLQDARFRLPKPADITVTNATSAGRRVEVVPRYALTEGSKPLLDGTVPL